MSHQRPEDVIPRNVLEAARRAGLEGPLWYVGTRNGPLQPRRKTLADIAREVADGRPPKETP